MRNIILALSLLLTTVAFAQQNLPAVPDSAFDHRAVKAAGAYLQTAGEHRTVAVCGAVLFGALGGYVLSNEESAQNNEALGYGLLGLGVGVGVGFSISASGLEIKAGKALQGIP